MPGQDAGRVAGQLGEVLRMRHDGVEDLVPVALVQLVSAAVHRDERRPRHGLGERGAVGEGEERVGASVDDEQRGGDVACRAFPFGAAAGERVVHEALRVGGAREIGFDERARRRFVERVSRARDRLGVADEHLLERLRPSDQSRSSNRAEYSR